MPLIESDLEKNETLALLSSINAPLLQHQKKRIRTLATKQELIQLQVAGITVADFTRNLFAAGRLLVWNAGGSLPFDYGDKDAVSFRDEIEFMENRKNFGDATWQDAIEIFETKAILLSSALQDFLDAIRSSPKSFPRSFVKSIRMLKTRIEIFRRQVRAIH